MAYRAYLQRGSNKLYLDAAPYELAQGFVPPAISEIPNIASGTSANQYGGGKLIDKRADSAAYAFSVRVMGSSNAHNEALVDRLERFVRSGTEAEPVYFCWRPADVIDFEPLYGQHNATRRAKVITGSVYKSAAFYTDRLRTKVIFADVNLIVNPPEGKRQRVATATGGIIEDTIGTQDGTSRGVIVAEATTNLISNPIFGHATPLTSWTTGADTISEVVTDTDFVLFGSSAVRLTRKTSGSAFSFYQTIQVTNTATHCLSCYVKKPDSSAVTSSDFQLRYGATTSAPSFMPVGNGWYRAWVTFSGASASAEVTGCTPIVSGGSLYVDGWQFEEKAYPTPLAYGDQLGCTWSSTAHDSATTRTVSSLRVPASEAIVPNQFTWWIAFRANCTFSEFATARVLLREDATNAYISAETTGQLSFSYDGTNGCAGAATAITAGQVVIVHATMDNSGVKLYRNGAADGAGSATFAPLASPTYLYVGSNETPGGHSNATILGAGTYNRAMTAAEVAADYANLYQAAIGLDTYGARVDWIPYLWTKDGDNVVDNCNDATRDNWCMVASVPGSLASNTEFLITPTTPYSTYYLALNPVSTYTDPTTQTYKDASGTAEATASGGEVQEMVSSYGFAYYIPANQSEFTGKIHFLARAFHNTGSNFANGAISYTTALSSSISAARTTPIVCPDDTTYNLYYLGHINWQYDAKALSSVHAAYEHGSGQQKLDYFMAIPGYLVRIDDPIGTIASFYISGTKIYGATTAYLVLRLTGDVIEVVPGKLNMLYFLMGTDTAENLVTDTATFTSVYITPRWALA